MRKKTPYPFAVDESEPLDTPNESCRSATTSNDGSRERIDYTEFRHRVPAHAGPSLSIEEMDRALDRMFEKRGRP